MTHCHIQNLLLLRTFTEKTVQNKDKATGNQSLQSDCNDACEQGQLGLESTFLRNQSSRYKEKSLYLDMPRSLQQPLVQLPGVLPVAFADLEVNVRLHKHTLHVTYCLSD